MYAATICHMSAGKRLDVAAIGRRLMEERERQQLAQEDLADRASLSRAYISRLERGVVPNPKLVDLAQVAEALGMSVAELTMPPSDSDDDDDLRQAIVSRLGPDRAEHALTMIARMQGRSLESLKKAVEVTKIILSE